MTPLPPSLYPLRALVTPRGYPGLYPFSFVWHVLNVVPLYSTGSSLPGPPPRGPSLGAGGAEGNKSKSTCEEALGTSGKYINRSLPYRALGCGNEAGGGGEAATGWKEVAGRPGQGWGGAPTCVAEVPVPAVVTNALPGFHAQSVNTAGKGHALVTQGTLPTRLAPVGVGGRKMGTYGGAGMQGELRLPSVEPRSLGGICMVPCQQVPGSKHQSPEQDSGVPESPGAGGEHCILPQWPALVSPCEGLSQHPHFCVSREESWLSPAPCPLLLLCSPSPPPPVSCGGEEAVCRNPATKPPSSCLTPRLPRILP